MAILETHDIGKRYGRRSWALRHVDIAVPDGSITALVGPNGSGKSTLLKAWVGFERPTRGPPDRRRHRPVARPRRRDRADRLRPAGAVALPRADGRGARDAGGDAAARLRSGRRAPPARRPRHPAHLPRRRAVWGTAGAGRAGARARGAGAGPPPRRAAGQPRSAGASRVPARPDRRGPRRRLDRAPVVARHHRHRAGLRPAARPRRRARCCSTCRSPAPSPSIVVEDVGPGGTTPAITGTVVGIFPGPAGERLSLVRGDGAGGRPATLEEVVLGHLAAARTPRPTVVPAERAA